MNPRRIHDSAWAGSIHIVETFKNLLRPEEQKDAFGAVYEILRALLEAHELLIERERQRIAPSRN